MSMWNFNADGTMDSLLPMTIVEDLCSELSQISRERIIARVTEYDGKYRSDHAATSHTTPKHWADSEDRVPRFDIQEIMGEKATDDDYTNKFVYELYLTSKNTPKYKYRVLIMAYGISLYPVELTIQEDIAKEANLDSEGVRCKDEAEFTAALNSILSSTTVGTVLNRLAALNP